MGLGWTVRIHPKLAHITLHYIKNRKDHEEQEPCCAGMTARCRCKFRYPSKFTAMSRGFHCNSNAFELNNSINHGKITVLHISIYCL